MERLADRAYRTLVGADPTDGSGLDRRLSGAVSGNALRQVAAMTLQKVGDVVVNPRTVLTWLLLQAGAPAAAVAMLVPVRESGSLIPQAGLVGFVRRRALRRWLWVGGAVGQAACTAAIAVIALTTEGAAAGWGVIAALAAFALARSVSSIASKDVLGRTVPQGARGRVTGAATVASGAVAITIGLALRTFGGDDTRAATLALLLGLAALSWVVAGTVYSTIREVPGERDVGGAGDGPAAALGLLHTDPTFRRFVLTRALLLTSALSPPFVVALATAHSGTGLEGLGPFVVAGGIAALVSGRAWGRIADRSSRDAMTWAAGLAAGVVLAFLAVIRVEVIARSALVYPAVYLALALVHTGARIGRKTYVVDLAEGNDRTDRVAVANATMGVVLLATGTLTAAASTLGTEAALATLALLGVAGVLVSRTLPEVTRTGT